MYNKCIFLDEGHGGIDPITNKYTTAPSKMYDHKKGRFHQGTTFLEGVSNRLYGTEIANLAVKEGINIIKTAHPYKDNSLNSRSVIANQYHSTIQEGIFVSLHSNAAQGTARGFSIWTSKGQTFSDTVATGLFTGFEKDLKPFNIAMRTEKGDGDPDYEENFSLLVNTSMPAVLIENLFFDNFDDAQILMRPDYRKAFAESLINNLKPFLK